jgi:hypothetical protein
MNDAELAASRAAAIRYLVIGGLVVLALYVAGLRLTR